MPCGDELLREKYSNADFRASQAYLHVNNHDFHETLKQNNFSGWFLGFGIECPNGIKHTWETVVDQTTPLDESDCCIN